MQNFVIKLLTCSVTMSALALFYMVVTPLLAKRYSERGRYYAWLIIVFGLIIPFRPNFDNAIIKVSVPSETVTPIVQIGNGTPITVPMNNAALPSMLVSISWWQIAAAVWLVGVIVFLSYHAIKHYCFVRMAGRWSERITDEQTLTLFHGLKKEMDISKRINLYLCSCAGSPMMIGFVNPRILLPKADLAHDEIHFILKHELVHYKRKDLLYKYLVLVATAIHWFNPVVSLMSKAIDVLCEISCDAEVVRSTDADTRQHYSETIIGVVKYQSKLKTALSTNFYGGKNGMKKRIFSIMDLGEKKTGMAIFCCIFILTLGTGVTLTANTMPKNSQVVQSERLEFDALIKEQTAKAFSEYEVFGLIYNQEQDLFRYDGKFVRQFYDFNAEKSFRKCSDFDFTDYNKAVDLTAIYDINGKLVGLSPADKEEFNQQTANIQKSKEKA